jgi:hypothetical protein
MRRKVRYGYISYAVAVVLLAADLILFHDNEEAMGIMGIAAFAICMGVFTVLCERDCRARTRRDQGRS